MRTADKLFTSINVGAFELRHRVACEWPPFRADPPFPTPSDLEIVAAALPGGLIIYEGWPIAARSGIFQSARAHGQSTVLRLESAGSDEPSRHALHMAEPVETAESPEAYAEAALAARLSGFDGVEIVASAAARSLLSRPTEIGASAMLEITEAVARRIGRDRVGVRLSPFRISPTPELDQSIYVEILHTLEDQEIAYVHLDDLLNCGTSHPSPLASRAAALRSAFSGVIIASGDFDLSRAADLVESRWADAFCFPGQEIDLTFLSRVRAELPGKPIA
jgi:hypothetical protein